ncbi:MAG: hypothetical protein WAU81_00110 [Candidatus Aminicenantales bacterium]
MYRHKEFLEGGRYKASNDRGGCWVDDTTVFYRYQDAPGGFRHAPLFRRRDRSHFLVLMAAANSDIIQNQLFNRRRTGDRPSEDSPPRPFAWDFFAYSFF